MKFNFAIIFALTALIISGLFAFRLYKENEELRNKSGSEKLNADKKKTLSESFAELEENFQEGRKRME